MYTMFALKIERVQCGITTVHRMCLPNGTTYWRVNRALWLFWNCYSFGWWDCRITDTRRVLLTFVGYNVSKGVMSGTAAFKWDGWCDVRDHVKLHIRFKTWAPCFKEIWAEN